MPGLLIPGVAAVAATGSAAPSEFTVTPAAPIPGETMFPELIPAALGPAVNVGSVPSVPNPAPLVPTETGETSLIVPTLALTVLDPTEIGVSAPPKPTLTPPCPTKCEGNVPLVLNPVPLVSTEGSGTVPKAPVTAPDPAKGPVTAPPMVAPAPALAAESDGSVPAVLIPMSVFPRGGNATVPTLPGTVPDPVKTDAVPPLAISPAPPFPTASDVGVPVVLTSTPLVPEEGRVRVVTVPTPSPSAPTPDLPLNVVPEVYVPLPLAMPPAAPGENVLSGTVVTPPKDPITPTG